MKEWPGVSASELERLEALYRESTREAATFARHPSEEDWERLAADELAADERTALADHVVTCPACRDAYRVVMEVRRLSSTAGAGAAPPPEADRWRPPVTSTTAASRWSGRELALAAAVLAALAAGVWGWSLRSRVGTLETRLAEARSGGELARVEAELEVAADRAARLERELADLRQPGVGAPIVDLEPDVVRSDGGGSRRTEVVVPESARYLTLVFTFTSDTVAGEPFAVEIASADGARLGAWPGVSPPPFETVSVVVPEALLPPGELTVRLVDGAGAALQTHRLIVRRGEDRSDDR